WLVLPILSPVSGRFATASKPVISILPPWTVIFQGQTVELTCNVFPFYTPKKIKWFLGTERSSETPVNTLEVNESGEYRCQAQGSPLSNPVHLVFSAASLILQAPLSVFEGDSVRLRCQQTAKVALTTLKFFRNAVLILSSESSVFNIDNASVKDNGVYHCTGYKKNNISVSSNTVEIQVQELFPRPVLTASPSQPTEGSPMTLTCETELSPERSAILLQFCFFRDDQTLIPGCSSSPEHQITTMRTKDSGSYWCEAKAITYKIKKQSLGFQIHVQIPVSHPVLTLSTPEARVHEGDVATLYCEAQRGSPRILYQFYHEDILLWDIFMPSGKASYSFPVTAQHSGNYHCTASNDFSHQRSGAVSLSVIVPVSRPVLTLRAPRTQAVVGDMVELHCEALRGTPPILYHFYHEDVTLGNSSAPSGGGVSFSISLTTEHSGSYSCDANNGRRTQCSDTVSLSVMIPVSHPILTLRAPRAKAVVGDMVELHCEVLRGSPPILYQFYREDVTLGSSSAPSGGGASFNLSLTTEHSGNYSCEADNGLGAQRSKVETLKVTVPVSRPVLTLRAFRTQAVVGDVVELHCEALRGSPPILYRFYHEDVILGSSSAPFGGRASFNFSLTTEHSGNYSCEADNGLGTQCSEVVTLSITGLTGNRSGPIATGVTGGLLSVVSLVTGALLLYCWLSRKAGGRLASDLSRSPSNSDPQEPTYHNVPAWIELQPVYSNVNPRGGDVVYSEVWSSQGENKYAAASAPALLRHQGSTVIYSQVKVASAPASGTQLLAPSAPHR
ncbi:Fc receptor-like protein 5, partial [Cynocephalus volans]|uniref:Fc receptor-like protein 5 n=1 Tax=Cynocephalus volans TaxID=110931 RepID=UPI002FCA12CB